jgi:N-acetylglucosamine-6-phosphate deacetylase
MEGYFIKNVKIITRNSIIAGRGVIVKNGKIASICDENRAETSCSVIDGNGMYLSPGFIDLHNHGNNGADAMDATYEALDTMSKFHIKNGVTGFLATTLTSSRENTLKAITNAVDFMGGKYNGASQVLGLYLEGPYFSQIKKGAQPAEYIADIDIDELSGYIEAGKGCIKILALAPELEKSADAVRFLTEKGITVAAGHTNATYAEAMDGINNGITEATHLYNGMRALSHKEPGVLAACLLDRRVCCEMICDGIHVHPATMKIAVKMKGRDNIALITDSLRGNGLPDGEYMDDGRMVIVKNNQVRLEDGTLAGSTLTLNRAVKNMVEKVGVSLCDAVYMASYNPAKQIGEADKKGSIDVGKDADLVIFDGGVNVKTVLVGGKIVYKC